MNKWIENIREPGGGHIETKKEKKSRIKREKRLNKFLKRLK